jgi:hypothetical protein
MAATWWVGEQELNDEQKDVISLSAEGNHLVTGPPGSGKTNILLLRANYLTLSGKPNIAIVVFTKTLRKFIASGGREYSFPAEKIMTSIKWQRDVLYQYGVTVNPPAGFQEQRNVPRSGAWQPHCEAQLVQHLRRHFAGRSTGLHTGGDCPIQDAR